MQSERTWGLRSIICFCLFLFFLAIFITSNRLFSKQLGFWLGLLFLVFTLLSFTIAKSRYDDLTSKNAAIILSSSAEIKNAPSNSGMKLFLLHEGTKVSVTQINTSPEGEWVMIQLNPEKVGWAKRSVLEFI